jgi:hypothetical protein
MLKLPPAVLVDFYKNSLVLPNTLAGNSSQQSGQPPVHDSHPANKTTSLYYKGGNEKNVLIAVNNTDYPFLSDDDLSLLVKMLTACGLTIRDIALINEENLSKRWDEILQELRPRIVLLFGSVKIREMLPFRVPDYQVQPHGEKVYLHAPALSSLLGESPAIKEEKKKLWTALQRVFKK